MALPSNRVRKVKLPDNTEYEIIPEKISDGYGNYAILPQVTLGTGESYAELATRKNLVTLSSTRTPTQIRILTIDSSQRISEIKAVRANTVQLNVLKEAKNFVDYCISNAPYNILSYTWSSGDPPVTKTMTVEDALSIYNIFLANNYATFEIIYSGSGSAEIISSMLLTDQGGLAWGVQTEQSQYNYSQSERPISINGTQIIAPKDFQALNFTDSTTINWSQITTSGITQLYAEAPYMVTTNTNQHINSKKYFDTYPQLPGITMSYYDIVQDESMDMPVIHFITDYNTQDTRSVGPLVDLPGHLRIQGYQDSNYDDKKPSSNFSGDELHAIFYNTGITLRDYDETEDESTYYKLRYPAKSGTIATTDDIGNIPIDDLTNINISGN